LLRPTEEPLAESKRARSAHYPLLSNRFRRVSNGFLEADRPTARVDGCGSLQCVNDSGSSDVEALVRSRLAEAQIPAGPEDMALFVAMYPLLRAKADRIYELDLGDAP